MHDPHLTRRQPSVRQKLVQVLAIAREINPAQHPQFADTITKLVADLKSECPTNPLRRFLDCLREADRRHGRTIKEFPTQIFLEPLVKEFGLAGYVVCAYISALPGFNALQSDHHQLMAKQGFGSFGTGLTRLQRVMDIPDIEATFCYDHPTWRVTALISCEDLLHRLCFSASTASSDYRQMTENDQHDLVKRVYKACANSRGSIAAPGVIGVFERLLRDSVPYLTNQDQHWHSRIQCLSDLHEFVNPREIKNFSDLATNQLNSNSPETVQFAAKIFSAAVIPINLQISKRLCQLLSTDSDCAKDAAMALKAGNFISEDSKQAAISIIEARIDDLRSRKLVTPKTQLTKDRCEDVLKSLTRPIEVDDELWGGDYTSAP